MVAMAQSKANGQGAISLLGFVEASVAGDGFVDGEGVGLKFPLCVRLGSVGCAHDQPLTAANLALGASISHTRPHPSP